MILDDKETCRKYGMRGHSKKRAEATYLVSGEYVTPNQITARLGLPHRNSVYRVLKKAQSMDGPVTWERLQDLM